MWVDTRPNKWYKSYTHANEQITDEKIRRLRKTVPPQNILTYLRLRVLTRKVWKHYPFGTNFR